MDKKNVFNYELEGFEWDYAPSILMYTREVRSSAIDSPPFPYDWRFESITQCHNNANR